jgi:NADP-dependent 3-hydroxy acid dehydrogenase YdfG
MLLAEGATVYATGRRYERLLELEPAARDGGRLVAAAGNVDDDAFRRSLVAGCERIDILVNAAGGLTQAPFLEGDPAAWETMWRTNVQSLLCLTQLAARRMSEQRSGHIVNISSILAAKVYPLTMVYAATKFAVRAISQGLRLELREHGIKVTEIAPGQVKTDIFRGEMHPVVSQAYKARTFAPLAPDDVARAILHALHAPAGTSIDVVEINPAGQS